eukprot:TRINITY_DN9341_c0_g1_i1.p1 TRINITY_DN9341_c0_g1~~TRINITY_DN9341_c0_g1_i1.p1  ORF type:complete len:167 (-),score=26.55 TRINITY_DN9341_c0_g1_i1:27-527(-)
MVPSAVVILPSFPLNANGKLDMTALPAPRRSSSSLLPLSAYEVRLASLWSELLTLPMSSVSSSDTFVSLGGHSLSLMQLKFRIQREFGVRVSFAELFKYTTLEALARHIEASKRVALPTIVHVDPQPDIARASFSQERLWFIDELYPSSSSLYHSSKSFLISGDLF